ncbi:glycosyltransferase [Vibrio salilacus]|uniref:glycosyltransferase n=1 Tax=Vibrio salilacus TaxID=1323749 RepID=UPI000C2AD476|nr:glycosyltransferase [Vibrio salilacus]
MRQKKLAFVVSGGYHTSLYLVTRDVVNELRSKGWEIDYIFVDPPKGGLKDNDKYLKIKGLSEETVYSFTGYRFRFFKNIFGKHLYQFLFRRYFCRQLDEHFKEYDGAIVHGSIFVGLSALKTPHYGVLHSCKYDNFLGRRRGIFKLVYQRVYQKVYGGKRLLSVSNSARDDMIQKMKAKPRSLETIYNGFNFDSLVARAEKGTTKDVPEKYIMAAGRPDRTKRFDILIKAYAKTKRTHKLVIFGEGRKLKELKELSINLGVADDVIFWGFCNNLLPYFKQASAYILSSDIEGLPTVVIESIAIGTPVVATEVGGVNELLSGRLNEWVVPKGDVDALAAKIDQVLEAPPQVGPEDLAFLDYRRVSEHYIALSEKLCD